MSRLLQSYLHTLRKQWGLSQPELADLLGVSPSALCKVETLARRPSVNLMLGAAVIFGHSVEEIFPAAYRDIEDAILKRACAEHKRLERQTDPTSIQRLRLLTEIIERSEARN